MEVKTLEDWVRVASVYPTEEKAKKAANIIEITESRLANSPNGPQYMVETMIEKVAEGWQILWRKLFSGYKSGCGGGCSSCGSEDTSRKKKEMGKVIPFKR